MSKKKLPMVVVVGRTNVGKSTLFNRLSVDARSLTLDQEGVTRDFITDTVSWQDVQFQLIDTGGISLRKTQDVMLEQTRLKAFSILESAALVIFMCDGKVGVIPEDREISRFLHRQGKSVFLVVNKTDALITQDTMHEFKRLGHDTIIPISAQHGKGIADLLEGVVEELKKLPVCFVEEEKPRCRVVILGKPNVGKSSLLNMLIKRERAIVADIPGTTREALTERIQFYKSVMQITDTPGLRKKRTVTDPLEHMMVKSAMAALRDGDIVLFMVDGTEGRIADQDLKLLFYAFEQQYKAIILLVNKQDLMDEYARTTLDFSLEKYEHFTKKIVRVDISCKTEQNVGKILTTVDEVWLRHAQQFTDEELTILFKDALLRKPLHKQGMTLNMFNVKQIRSSPITIVFRTNLPQFFGPSQLAFLESVLRQKYDLKGVPVHLIARKK